MPSAIPHGLGCSGLVPVRTKTREVLFFVLPSLMTVSVEQSIINRLVESEPLRDEQSFNKFVVIVSLANNLSYSEFIVIRAEVLHCFSSSTQSEAGSLRDCIHSRCGLHWVLPLLWGLDRTGWAGKGAGTVFFGQLLKLFKSLP